MAAGVPLPPPPPPPPLPPPPHPALAVNATAARTAIAVLKARDRPRKQISISPTQNAQTIVTSVVGAGRRFTRTTGGTTEAFVVQSGELVTQGIAIVPAVTSLNTHVL